MQKAVFVAPLRTPFGRAFKGFLAETRPDDLLLSLLEQQKLRNPQIFEYEINDLICGCAYPEGEQGYNIARLVSLGAGLQLPGLTINRLCASSLEAVAIAAARVNVGQADAVLVAGVESMSRIPRKGAGFSESDQIRNACPQAYINMGDTAEEIASRSGISRSAQEEFAARSHELAELAYASNHYANHVIEMNNVLKDEGIRVPVNYVKMASLAPAFKQDGCVTAATSSPLSDGAVSAFVVNQSIARELGMGGLEIVDVCWGHVEPQVMGLGPVPAVTKLLKRQKLTPDQIDIYEINEAFAVQVLACQHELGLSLEKINQWGGAISMGHPLGASGLRLMMTLLERMRFNYDAGALGIATLCVGGGQGLAILARYLP